MSQAEITKKRFYPQVGLSNVPLSTRSTKWIDFKWEQSITKILYKKSSDSDWIEKEGYARLIPDIAVVVHTVVLDGLDADTEYDLRIGEDQAVLRVYATSKGNASNTVVAHWHTPHPMKSEYPTPTGSANDYSVSTMPQSLDDRALKVAVGGDVVRFRQQAFDIMELLGDQEVDIFVCGGDIANADSEPDDWHQWEEFWDAYTSGTTRNGKLLLILTLPGNHDAIPNLFAEPFDFSNEKKGEAWLYQSQFPEFPPAPTSYGVVDIGDDLSIFCLDTRHILPTEEDWDAQDDWLQTEINNRSERKFLLPAYHRSTFPAIRNINLSVDNNTRRTWLPMFQETGALHAAFEHHEHVFKVTEPLKHFYFSVTSENEILNVQDHGLSNGTIIAFASGSGNLDFMHEGKYFTHALDSNNITLHNSEAEALSGDNPLIYTGDGGQFYAKVDTNDGFTVFGSGCMADAIRDVRNPATTWYIKDALGNQFVEGLDGPHLDDGQDSYEDIPGEKAWNFYVATFEPTKLTVDAFSVLLAKFFTHEKDI